MKVKAINRGFWPHNRERQPGEVFDYDGPTSRESGGKKVAYFPSWVKKLPEPKPKPDPEDEAKKAAEKEAAEKAAAEKAAGNKTGE